MTSSLVGSEMCIRDRHQVVREAHLQPHFPKLCLGQVKCLDKIRVNAPGAVSYTHLTLPTICSV
eukprot:2454318-Prorocentrum_lima.AAC.1